MWRIMKKPSEEKTRCSDPRGNEICTDGRTTYHNWNVTYGSRCEFCKQTNPDYENEYCECERCTNCGKLIK